MKRLAIYFGFTALVASCSIQEENFETPTLKDDVIFYASFEQPSEESTRVYVNEDLLLRWTVDDRVSIFNKNTYNQEYKFLGETGDKTGEFNEVTGASFVTGNEISHVVSVYPYREGTKISEDETIILTLPAKQHYADNTFGLGANTMVSVSTDKNLQYKTIGGYLRISLYGEGVSVSSIVLKGNNGEKLAGKATVTMPLDGVPSMTMANDASSEITLTCATPVQLGATAEESTPFWFVVPPVTFSKGFTITVTGDKGEFNKSTEKNVAVERNILSKMSPLKVELSQPRNVIYYTSSDGNVVAPYNPSAFGASILSNEYLDGQGMITFDGNVTLIGEGAFCDDRLTSISIPEGVKSLGDRAFAACSSLTSIRIPDSVTSLGNGVFAWCYSLEAFTGKFASTDELFLIDSGRLVAAAYSSIDGVLHIPEGVTSIGEYAVTDCSSLTSLIFPQSVTEIGYSAFSSCANLKSISFSEGLIRISLSAFYNCTSLQSAVLPDGLETIAQSSFSHCTNLTSIALPNSLTWIGDEAFIGCSSLSGISFPESLTWIGVRAFYGCTSLTRIVIPESVEWVCGGAFGGCSSIESYSGKFASSDGLFIICSDSNNYTSINAVANGAIYDGLILPEGIDSIGDYVFDNCTNLTSIFCQERLSSIGYMSFHGCTNLVSVSLPESVTIIGARSFFGCSSLTSITIPSKVTRIGNEAFWGCNSMASITVLPETPPTAGYYMFTHTKCSIYVPSGSVDAYKSAERWSDYADRIQAITE